MSVSSKSAPKALFDVLAFSKPVVYFSVDVHETHVCMTLTLAFTLAWYLGALALLWYASMRYCEGVSLSRTVPLGFVAMLMLTTASGIYYEYTDAPLFRVTYMLWAVVLLWLAAASRRSRSTSSQ
ncbi:hypothetical protein A3C89_03095 [Candidatus Kaiserbacteria bacterium RIFCSPHIGHO2_02_FULL_50_50]|uniref:Uncharacterized protein n=1 Tax=Candidatus Kaiserbacteria bacterium RIFCSPHIGHO2_02_FULL_50_50 TaxID=1798492 RepID=A0A1F6DFW3_9BACT|nr:MAG: hypothetical protein A3C89_03095 [Candidatus Kaiserbacteria bacterium RIFCSPHIGHO2_02_FULL_50_50]OGG89066.1 MAG: hypothetical protein A3G62_04010 [Candidatus Kaiserbacteria bacterium RIFCSPLOWO2_12_FULL_50_10]